MLDFVDAKLKFITELNSIISTISFFELRKAPSKIIKNMKGVNFATTSMKRDFARFESYFIAIARTLISGKKIVKKNK